MNDTVRRHGAGPKRITNAMDMPETAGQCAFLGGYVNEGETVCWNNRVYVCRAPKLVWTNKTC
jgi:hypothetical protein